MNKNLAHERIRDFFRQNELNAKDVKKIKRLAMQHNIKLGEYRKRFCKKCYSDLKSGKTRITKIYKVVECPACKQNNKYKIKKK